MYCLRCTADTLLPTLYRRCCTAQVLALVQSLHALAVYLRVLRPLTTHPPGVRLRQLTSALLGAVVQAAPDRTRKEEGS